MKIIKKFIICISFLFFIFLFKNVAEVNAASYIWPVGGQNFTDTYIEYFYGKRTYNYTTYDNKYNYSPYEQYYSKQENHFGVDITGKKGETYEIVSICNGKVIATSANRYYSYGTSFPDRNKRRASSDGGGYGNYVIIQDTSNGKCFMYAHLKANSITVKRGDTVKVGQKIGVMGSSGDSGHMHLHFEVRKNLQSTTINNGGSLVVTTGFNVQTEDPTLYIGKTPSTPAKKSKVSYCNYTNYKQVNIYFSKPVTVKSVPTLKVKVGNEIKNAKYLGISSDNKKISYAIYYNNFDVFTSGKMYIALTDGSIVDKTYPSINVNCGINNNYTIGTLSTYRIDNTFENIVCNRAGDVNEDGKINAIDASIVMSLYATNSTRNTLTSTELKASEKADVNNDGKLTAIDASIILTYYSKRSTGLTINTCKTIIKCDFNNDYRITITDYKLLQNAINSKKYSASYDLNNDKKLNSNDLNYIKTIVKQNGHR